MTKFKGFELVRLIKATTTPHHGGDAGETHVYEVELHGMHGAHTLSTHISLSDFQRNWSKDLGMTKCRYGKLQYGQVSLLSYDDYNKAVIDWNNI